MPKDITVRVCPQCEGDCKPLPGTYNWQCADCGWSGETTKQETENGQNTGKLMLRKRTVK